MKNMKYALGLIVVILLFSLSMYWLGGQSVKNKTNNQEINLTSEVILDKITDQYFIVTKTLFFDEEIELIIDEGSEWNNLLWGEEILAEGIIRVDIGVDMQNTSLNDIKIDNQNRIIEITLDDPTILDASLTGEISLETKKGIIKNIEDIFKREEGDDYNRAVNALIEQAEGQAIKRKDILAEAKEDSVKLIKLVMQDLGYEVIFK